MAIDYTPREDDAEPAQADPVGAPSPALQDFAGVFTHPDAQGWAGEVTTRLNDYFQQRQLVTDNEAAGQNFVNDLGQFKSGLVGMVQSDPQAVHTALDIVPPTIAGIIGTMPNAPEDADAHHAALTDHMQAEIAAAAVTSAAESNEGMARSLLADGRIRGVLGDHADALDTYTSMQAAARSRDAAAQAGQAQAAHAELADQSARNYLSALIDPNNGKPRSPPGWNQAVMADDRVPPQLKVDLFNAHEQLGVNGDAKTDPLAVMGFLDRMLQGGAKQADIYPMIGSSLSLADASTLTGLLRNPNRAAQLNETVKAAQRILAPDGDIAQTRALGRFVDFVMPLVAQGAVLDPRSDDWVLADHGRMHEIWRSFQTTGDDLLGSTPQRYLEEGTFDRPSLGSIFGGGKKMPSMRTPLATPPEPGKNPLIMAEGNQARPTIPGDPSEVINRPAPEGTESGGFFQRKLNEGGGKIMPLKMG